MVNIPYKVFSSNNLGVQVFCCCDMTIIANHRIDVSIKVQQIIVYIKAISK